MFIHAIYMNGIILIWPFMIILNASNNYCDNANHLHVIDFLQKYYDHITIIDFKHLFRSNSDPRTQ